MNGSGVLRLGTRGSRLSLAQAELARAALAGIGVESELVVVETRGDREADAPLSRIGGQGVFARALEEALMAGEIDAAAHSAKDVPSTLMAGTVFAAVLSRGDVRDVLATREGVGLSGLRSGARVGTGSGRRAAQLLGARSDLRIVGIRGNIDTRLGKLREGEYDAIVLAAAGLERLPQVLDGVGLAYFAPDQMLPAPGQGAIAIQALSEHAERYAGEWAAVDDRGARLSVASERGVLRGLGADCALPVAALGHWRGGQLTLAARLLAADGSSRLELQRSGAVAGEEEASALGEGVARGLLERGGREMMAASEGSVGSE